MSDNINVQSYTAHKDTLLKKYPAKYAVIADGKIQKVFDDNSEAYLYGAARYSTDDFIIRHLTAQKETVTFYHRVAI